MTRLIGCTVTFKTHDIHTRCASADLTVRSQPSRMVPRLSFVQQPATLARRSQAAAACSRCVCQIRLFASVKENFSRLDHTLNALLKYRLQSERARERETE